MPDNVEHLKKAEHNEAFFNSLEIDKTPYLDWLVNGIFYSAIHYIEAYLAIENKHSESHSARNIFIEEDPNLGRRFFRDLYRALRDDCYGGRYLMRVFTPDEIKKYLIPNFEQIKQYLQQYIPQIKM
jgi:hypothetical protein